MAISVVDPLTAESQRLRLAGRVAARTLVAVAAVSAVAVLWLHLGPVEWGGRASYVITDGISMLPTFRADGLVITEADDGYRVGDVVAYHNRQLGAVVMHRIVARDGRRYVFKGDNNDFRDTYHPTKTELVGKEWMYLPGLGRYLLVLRQPWVFAAVVALIALMSFGKPARKRKRRGHAH